MRSRLLVRLAVAVFLSTFVFAYTAGAQETPDASVSAAATDTQGGASEQTLVFADGEQKAQAEARAEAQQPGPLAGTRVGTRSTDSDPFVEVIEIPAPDCAARQGASFVLQDEDGTQADFIDNDNIQIIEVRKGLNAVSSLPGQNADIVPLNVRGGDDVLDTGGLVIVTSTDIKCKGDNPPPTTPPPTNPPPTNPPPTNPPPSASPQPEPQDKDKGPLAGGTAVGKDVLVPGDVIDVLPDGTKVVGIDQVIIKTENCKLTAQGDDLTITLSDRGVPFRLRDGDNVDITIKPDGTIVANGRKTLGESFPPGQRNNPTRVIRPIPVDPENDTFPEEPNDTYKIVSSTGIGGKGCHVVDGADTSNTNDNGNSSDDVIPETVSDKPLPNTGGVPLSGLIVAGLVFAGAGLLLFRSTTRRNT
ncbi:MAG: LPXTG cell wall anchor domain-containing protein [Rubrobacteraceae bacterium]|nr:LPXTG cell wall anchor domain-containing protein [Rubrobacteraceae bacterium]